MQKREKERFEFLFTVNGNIICQRYFRINKFREDSLGSNELVTAISSCVELINDDLKAKSNIYSWYSAPQVFKSREQMKKWVKNPTFYLKAPHYAVIDGTDEVYVWNGSQMEPYFNNENNVGGYLKDDGSVSIFKFAFLDNGKEIHSLSWDGRNYPKFVRSNIDLSNSKNKYRMENNNYVSPECFIVDRFIASQSDIIPQIVKKICVVCSFPEDVEYSKNLSIKTINYPSLEVITTDYGYPTDTTLQYHKYMDKLSKKYFKKTEAYYKNLNVG